MEGISKQVGQFDAGNGGLEGMKHAILLDLNGILCDNFQKFLEGTYFIIFKLSTVYIRKMFFGTFYLCPFYFPVLQGRIAGFGFGYKIRILRQLLFEDDGPVRMVFSHWSRDIETVG